MNGSGSQITRTGTGPVYLLNFGLGLGRDGSENTLRCHPLPLIYLQDSCRRVLCPRKRHHFIILAKSGLIIIKRPVGMILQ